MVFCSRSQPGDRQTFVIRFGVLGMFVQHDIFWGKVFAEGTKQCSSSCIACFVMFGEFEMRGMLRKKKPFNPGVEQLVQKSLC